MEDLWRHSLDTATAAKAIALAQGLSRAQAEEVFVAGVLEDLGILVLASNFPQAYDRAIESLLAEKALLTTVEQQEFAVTHAEVGAYLLGLWGIPAPVLDIVSMHHTPHLITDPGISQVLAVYAADILVGELGGNPIFRTGGFDLTTLDRLGLADRVEPWRTAVRAQKAQQGGDIHG